MSSPSKRKATDASVSQSADKKIKTDSDDTKTTSASAAAATAAATDRPAYTLNVNHVMDKEHETSSFHEIIALPPSALQGLAPKADEFLRGLGVKTIADLANWKYFKLARSILVLSDREEKGKRDPTSVMNLNSGLDKAQEVSSLVELCDAPVSAIQGFGLHAESLLKLLHIKTIRQLGEWKYCLWAEALVSAADFENLDHGSK
jgi:predicted flap endonuclease-1-like 5' DNA nuclease